MSLHSEVDDYMLFFSEPDFQGNAVGVPVHELISVYSDEIWAYRSVKTNGHKLYINAFYVVEQDQYPCQYRTEFFSSEDVADLTVFTKDIEGIADVSAGVLLADDIIVSMDVTNKMRDFQTTIVASLTAPNILSLISLTGTLIPGLTIGETVQSVPIMLCLR